MSNTSSSTPFKSDPQDSKLRQRLQSDNDTPVTLSSLLKTKNDEDKDEDEEEVFDEEDMKRQYIAIIDFIKKIEAIVAPIIFTIIGAYFRLKNIAKSDIVVWDEAHFGKFGSYYLKHEFYFDVHPPLGKLLVALSGYLANYDGSFDFDSNTKYPKDVDFAAMRVFNCLFNIACIPIGYFTAKELKFSLSSVWLLTIMVTFEMTYVALSKFILLDSFLLFFTFTTFFCLVKFYNLNNQLNQQKDSRFKLKLKWFSWLILSGISIGCVCSIKMVGLFVTSIFGLVTVIDLWKLYLDKTISWKAYLTHWFFRIFGLIIVPFMTLLFTYKIHFDMLYKSGTGDPNMSSLFQANLENTEIVSGPRSIAYGSKVTIKSQGLAPGLLHSHTQRYPTGSLQQQITTYNFKDDNNDWIIEFPRLTFNDKELYFSTVGLNFPPQFITNGNKIRLQHIHTNINLHSHDVAAPLSQKLFEVSGYGNQTIGDEKDNWIVEIVDQATSDEDKDKIHPITTSFRLKHQNLGCYLATTGNNLPAWGYRQGEVVCKHAWNPKDKLTWWNIENHENERLPPPPTNWKPPKTKFLKNFILMNIAMMSSNNGLVPDYDKRDPIASEAWEWPTLHVGLRLCNWGIKTLKFYLIGNPAIVWPTSLSIILFILATGISILLWQRQVIKINESFLNHYFIAGLVPFLSWIMHYLPFVIMSRVTYVHHYLPAVYFAMIVLTYLIDEFSNRFILFKFKNNGNILNVVIYFAFYALIISTFMKYSPLCLGMTGSPQNYSNLNLLKSWKLTSLF